MLNKLQGDFNFPKAQALVCIRQTVSILTKTLSFSDCLSGLWGKSLRGAGRSLWRRHVHHVDFYIPTGTSEHPWATVPWAIWSSLSESKRLLYHEAWKEQQLFSVTPKGFSKKTLMSPSLRRDCGATVCCRMWKWYWALYVLYSDCNMGRSWQSLKHSYTGAVNGRYW